MEMDWALYFLGDAGNEGKGKAKARERGDSVVEMENFKEVLLGHACKECLEQKRGECGCPICV